jgi:hypothetical protein
MTSPRTALVRLTLIATLGLSCLATESGTARASNSCATVEVFLYNLSSNQIAATWVDVNGNHTQATVAGTNAVYLGQQCINVSGEAPFQLSIQDPADGFSLAEYSLDAESCAPENWLHALSNFPDDCWALSATGIPLPGTFSYHILSDRQNVCLKGPLSDPALGPNPAVGIASLSFSCPGPTFSAQFKNPAGPFSWPIAVGTYTPTAGPLPAQPVYPGISPSGVTACLGSSCIIPNNNTDFNFWPVTIYWDPTAGGGAGLTYNSNPNFALYGTYDGFNIGSHLSSYLDAGGDDIYVPPTASAIQNLPAPCWPTFDTSGNLSSCSPSLANAPAYVANPNYKPSGIVKTAIKITAETVTAIGNIITIWGVF